MSETVSDWLLDRPVEQLSVEDLVVARARSTDSEDLVVAVNESLEHLRPWMPWAQQSATRESINVFLSAAEEQWENGTEFQFVIRRSGSQPILGCFGLHARLGPRALEIGYWLHVDEVGRGTATAVARALTETALSLSQVDRVEIRCDAANARSAAIPARLGYRLETREQRPHATPGETETHLIWVFHRADQISPAAP